MIECHSGAMPRIIQYGGQHLPMEARGLHLERWSYVMHEANVCIHFVCMYIYIYICTLPSEVCFNIQSIWDSREIHFDCLSTQLPSFRFEYQCHNWCTCTQRCMMVFKLVFKLLYWRPNRYTGFQIAKHVLALRVTHPRV